MTNEGIILTMLNVFVRMYKSLKHWCTVSLPSPTNSICLKKENNEPLKRKYPLAVFLLYHTDNNEGQAIYDSLYKILCRNAEEPLSDGLDIPVYFCNGTDSQPINSIDYEIAEKSVVVPLIDQNMYISSVWKEFIKNIPFKNNIYIYPISQTKFAFDFLSRIKEYQFISLKTFSVLDNWDEFKTRVFDCLIRVLSNDLGKKVKVFISHSKRDKDDIGRVRAESLRNYLRSETKEDSFYDVNDINDGLRFDHQIEKNVQDSLLIVLFTNTYSSREWCRRELLTAKKNKVPAILVFMVDDDIDRIFPYIGNIPSTIYKDDWRSVVNLLFKTALDLYYEQNLLEGMRNSDTTDVLPFSPEAFSLSFLDESKSKILYPEPPLGNEELVVLQQIRHGIQLYTPMQYLSQKIDLKEKRIAISVSESDDLELHGMGQSMLRDLTVELSRHILIANGKLVYGGDLREGGYTELFKELSYQYGQYEKADSTHFYFENYISWPITTTLTDEVTADFMHNRVKIIPVDPADECKILSDVGKYIPPNRVENLYLWGRSLSRMRKEMEAVVSARIIVGGRCSGFNGCMAGLLEEFKLAKESKHPIFLVGGFGGVAGMLCKVIRKEIHYSIFKNEACKLSSYSSLCLYYEQKGNYIDYSWLDGLSYDDLQNGLNNEDNQRLFDSKNVMEIVSLIIKGLSTLN